MVENKKNILTYTGLKQLEDELQQLKVVRRQEVAEKLKEARAQGDLSENAEYDAAKDEQRDIEARIEELENILKNAVAALAAATPIDTGQTANSWYYKIEQRKKGVTISFYNTNVQNGVPIAIILQYGHATRNGGWVQGRNYINPAIQPIFDKIANEAWREVTK